MNNVTEVVFLLDRSGSMSHLVDDTIGGFNSMIENQKKEDGEAYITTILFDDKYEILHDHVNIKDIKPITNKDYYARGMTALLDAIGKTINSINDRIDSTSKEERPDKTIFIITTDGLENNSKEFTKDTIKKMINHQENGHDWTFMFIGANMDAISEASSYGIKSSHSHDYTADSIGTTSVYACLDSAISGLRNVDYCSATADTEVNSIVEESLNFIK